MQIALDGTVGEITVSSNGRELSFMILYSSPGKLVIEITNELLSYMHNAAASGTEPPKKIARRRNGDSSSVGVSEIRDSDGNVVAYRARRGGKNKICKVVDGGDALADAKRFADGDDDATNADDGDGGGGASPSGGSEDEYAPSGDASDAPDADGMLAASGA